jgi:hypothetical protein
VRRNLVPDWSVSAGTIRRTGNAKSDQLVVPWVCVPVIRRVLAGERGMSDGISLTYHIDFAFGWRIPDVAARTQLGLLPEWIARLVGNRADSATIDGTCLIYGRSSRANHIARARPFSSARSMPV